MLKPTKTTLDQSDLDKLNLTYFRQDGNSTRQVNLAVQMLFKGETVQVLDHWEHGRHKEANEHLFNMILDRLTCEHGLRTKDDMEVDRNKLIIKLKSK